MVDMGATRQKGWRRSTWALAIGTGLALLVICLKTSQQPTDMPWPLVYLAVGWLMLAWPLYDRHRWPAKAFLILTALAAVLVMLVFAREPSCSSRDMCIYAAEGQGIFAAVIVMLWFLGGAMLAIIRFFIFGRDSAAAWRAEGRCFNCGGLIEPHEGSGRPPTRCKACRS